MSSLLSIQIDIETTKSHPFFVYGKGWASVNPDISMDEFNLKCHKLEVGDICISLKPRDYREKVSKTSTASQSTSSFQSKSGASIDLTSSVNCNSHRMPQNLSIKPSAIPATTTGTSINSRPMHPYDFQAMAHAQQQHHDAMNDPRSQYAHRIGHPLDDRRVPAIQRTFSHDSSPRKYNVTDPTMPPPPRPLYISESDRAAMLANEEALDATIRSNRKRRWSAPDNICNVDGCQLEQRKCTKH